MIKIIFMRSEKAYLPEIDAYIDYFNKMKGFRAYDSSKIKGKYKLEDYDVIWKIMGFKGPNVKSRITVHEYASLSTGRFSKIKNYLKGKLTRKPDLRIFLNKNVQNGLNFNDEIDFCYRDMGIDKSFLSFHNTKKEFDFVYIGDISKERDVDKLLKEFTRTDSGTMCLIGAVEDEIFEKYKVNKKLTFTGKIPHSQVAIMASKAKYGINYIPDRHPFNMQTSTKLLEYLALNLKIVTTDYKWVREFESKHDTIFYKISHNKPVINLSQVENYDFPVNININEYLWSNVIDKSNIANLIRDLSLKK